MEHGDCNLMQLFTALWPDCKRIKFLLLRKKLMIFRNCVVYKYSTYFQSHCNAKTIITLANIKGILKRSHDCVCVGLENGYDSYELIYFAQTAIILNSIHTRSHYTWSRVANAIWKLIGFVLKMKTMNYANHIQNCFYPCDFFFGGGKWKQI